MNRLKRASVLFLILVILFPGETAHAFSFIPKFISHYNHHNKEHHQLSFIDFVGEHLSEGHHKNKEHHEQDNCPSNHDHVLVSLTFVLEKKATLEVISQNHFQLYKKHLFLPTNPCFRNFIPQFGNRQN